MFYSDLLNEGVARDQEVVDDYEGDDAADGQIENHHYPVVQRGKLDVSFDQLFFCCISANSDFYAKWRGKDFFYQLMPRLGFEPTSRH